MDINFNTTLNTPPARKTSTLHALWLQLKFDEASEDSSYTQVYLYLVWRIIMENERQIVNK